MTGIPEYHHCFYRQVPYLLLFLQFAMVCPTVRFDRQESIMERIRLRREQEVAPEASNSSTFTSSTAFMPRSLTPLPTTFTKNSKRTTTK